MASLNKTNNTDQLIVEEMSDKQVEETVSDLIARVSIEDEAHPVTNEPAMGQKPTKVARKAAEKDATAPPEETAPVDDSVEESGAESLVESAPVEDSTSSVNNVPEESAPVEQVASNDQATNLPVGPPTAVGRSGETLGGTDVFRTRMIPFNGKSYRIAMQAANGPCPLLAAVNALSLQGRIRIPARTIDGGADQVTRSDLIQLIATVIIELPQNLSENQLANHEFNVADVLNLLPEIGRGLDVNLRFNDVRSFEYTPAIAMYDLLKLDLYHMWHVEGDFVELVGDLTYNQVTAKATENALYNEWLERSPTMITATGLLSVQERMTDGSFGVLFLNSHFSTIYKRNGRLYCLNSDEGFLGAPQIWGSVEDLSGDYQWVDCEFRPIVAKADIPSPETSSSASAQSDFELALKMQEEEDRRAAAAAQRQRAPPPAPQMQPSQQSRSQTPSQGSRDGTATKSKGNCRIM